VQLEVSNGTLKTNTTNFTLVPVVISSGSVLKGTGTIGAATVLSGASINVGNSPGCMTLASLNLNNGATFTTEIAGNDVCTGYDRTTVTGTADITGATLQVVLSTTPPNGQVFTVLSAGTVTGTYNGLADGSIVTVNGVQLRVNYTATSVTLTKIAGTLSDTGSESLYATVALLGIVVLALGLTRRAKIND
jgi:hypothetical protein